MHLSCYRTKNMHYTKPPEMDRTWLVYGTPTYCGTGHFRSTGYLQMRRSSWLPYVSPFVIILTHASHQCKCLIGWWLTVTSTVFSFCGVLDFDRISLDGSKQSRYDHRDYGDVSDDGDRRCRSSSWHGVIYVTVVETLADVAAHATGVTMNVPVAWRRELWTWWWRGYVVFV